MGGNKGQGGTSYQSSQVQIPPEVMARYNAVNARAETAASTPWQAYTGEFVAPVNPTQSGGINTITGAAGVDTPYFNQATGVINQALPQTQQLYGTATGQVGAGLAAGQQYTNQGLSTAAQTATAALPYAGTATGQLNSGYGAAQPLNAAAVGLAAGATGAVNPGDLDINRYMSPYNEAVVQSTLGNLRQQQRMDQADLRDSQILSGSFGGDRSGVGAANLKRQQDMAYGQIASQLYNANYGQALGAAQQQQGVTLGAAQANRAALASGAQNIAGIGNQIFGQGSAAAQGNLGIGNQVYGQGMGLASAQMQGGNQLYQQGVGAAGANAGLASGMAGTAAGTAGTLGQLGTQQQANQLQQGQAQIGAGTVQQQTQQALDTALYNQFLQERGYPFQVAQFLANIAMGTGAQSGSTTNTVATQAQPYFSDERLKENVHVIGRTHDGQPIIRFNYKGDPSTQIGLSAQETEKHHPEAVGLSSGYKTVDYDAATRDSIEKAGGGGLAAGNDNFAQLLAQQRAMFPGGHDPRGIASGVGPHGIPIAPLKAQAPQAAKVSMPERQQQTGAKRDIDSVMGLYNTGKGLASGYSEAKDALVGTAGRDGKDGSGGLLGSGGKWDPKAGWFGQTFGNDNAPSGKITTTELPPVAAPETADAGLAYDPTGVMRAAGGAVEAPAINVPTSGLGSGGLPFGEADDGTIPTIGKGSIAREAAGAGDGAAGGLSASETALNNAPNWGGAWARGGRLHRAGGGLATMPYGAEGYIPDELYEPVKPEKPDEAATPKMGAPGGGGKDGTGKAIGSLAGMGIGAMFGMPGVGSMIGGGLGGLFNEGGRVGLAAGGPPVGEDEASRIAAEDGSNVLPFQRPGPRAEPVSQSTGLATGAPNEPGPTVRERFQRAMSVPPRDLATMGANVVRQVVGTSSATPPTPSGPAGNMFPESGTPTGLAAGYEKPSMVGGVPTLPDGTPIVDTPPAAPAAPAAPATQPAATNAVTLARSMMPQPAAADGAPTPDDVFQRMLTQESGQRQFDPKGFPVRSSAGAIGIAQVMPGTGPEAAQLAGLQWRPDLFNRTRTGDPALDKEAEDYNRQLGQAYYKAQVQKYGDPYVAAAAYNAGPGAVDSAMQKARERGGSYLDYLPAETQNYVAIVSGKAQPRQAPASLRDDSAAGTPGGLAGGQSAAPLGTEAKEPEGFLDRAGSWIDRNQRPIMAGLAFIGNMLGSKSHQLTGAIGDGLAAAAPMYMATGFKETELKQAQERIDIGARAQYMQVLARQQQMQNDFMYANKGRRSPELDAAMAQTIARINGKGGVAAVPGGTLQTGTSDAPVPGKTDLAPQGVPAGPAAGPVVSTPLPPPAGSTPTPEPGTYTGGPPPMTANFLNQLDPDRNPQLLREQARRQYANGDRDGGARLENQARKEEEDILARGYGIGPGNRQIKLDGWDTYKAMDTNRTVNQEWLQKAETATQQRLKARQNVRQIMKLIEDFETGTGTDIKAQVAGVADALGIARPKTDTMDQAAFKSFLKDAYDQILQQGAGGRDTDAMRSQVEGAFANPTLPPEANKKILSQFLGNLDYEDAYAEQLASEIKRNQLVDQKIVGDQWRAKDREKNNPEYYRSEAYKKIAVLGATPENIRDIKDGHDYMLKPEDFYRLQGPNPKYTPQQIQQWYREQGKRAVKFTATRNETGGIDWKMVK